VRTVARWTLVTGLWLVLAATAEARADAPRCGDVVTDDVVLRDDLLDCPGDGLIAMGADITIDLNHHRVDGTGAGAGIRVLAPRITVRDGRITEFQDGVLVPADGLEHARLTRLQIAHNGRGVMLVGPLPPGPPEDGALTLTTSAIHHNAAAAVLASGWPHRSRIGESLIDANGAGVVFRDSRGGTVERNLLTRNRLAGVGFDFSTAGRVSENLISGNGTWGLQANRSTDLRVSRNVVLRNGTAGRPGGGAVVVEGLATIDRNVFSHNLGNGLHLDEFLATRSLWRIDDNTASRNTGFGIFAAQEGFGGGGNTARQNGEPAQCFNFRCR
jgi:nitrous oxidase accessory protein NosD